MAPKPAKRGQPPLHDVANPGDGNTYGLKLTVPGAPLTPHTVLFEIRDRKDRADHGRFAPLLGLYRPDQPTPVGGIGECPLEQAIAASRQPGCGVELVQVAESDLERLRADHQDALEAARGVTSELVLEARRGALDGGEVERVTDELVATGQKES